MSCLAESDALLLDQGSLLLWRHDLVLWHEEVPGDVDQQIRLGKLLQLVL